MHAFKVFIKEKWRKKDSPKRISVSVFACASLSSIFLSACATTAPTHSNLKVDQSAVVQIAGKPATDIKAGESIPLTEYPVLVESPGYMSVLLVSPKNSSENEVSLTLRSQETFGGKSFDHKVNHTVGEVVSSVNEIQILIGRQKVDQAFEKLNLLQQKYPEFTWLNFLRASCLLIKGKKGEAKAALEIALRDFPNDTEGKRFDQLLNGKPNPGGRH
jgi:hypothetical protein